MSFEFEIDPKDAASAEFMLHIHKVLQREMLHAAKEEKLTKSRIAELLGVDKSNVTRALNGKSNLTIRTISELCWALGVVPEFEIRKGNADAGCNAVVVKPFERCVLASKGKSNGHTTTVSWKSASSKPDAMNSSRSRKNFTKVQYAS